MKKLLTHATEKYDDCQGFYMKEFRHVLELANLLEMQEANEHSTRR